MPNSTFCGGREHKRTAFFFLLELRYSLLEFVNSRKNCQLLTKWKKWNKRDEVWSSETLPFKWRFRCRRCCLSSLKRPNGFWGAGVKRETRERRVKRASCSRPKTCLSAKTWRILARIFNTDDTIIFHDSFQRNSLRASFRGTKAKLEKRLIHSLKMLTLASFGRRRAELNADKTSGDKALFLFYFLCALWIALFPPPNTDYTSGRMAGLFKNERRTKAPQ